MQERTVYRDEKVKMKETIEKMQKQQQKLEVELKQKESELEDLGCWRWLLAKVGLIKLSLLITIFRRERNRSSS